jgi:hypothetical protein
MPGFLKLNSYKAFLHPVQTNPHREATIFEHYFQTCQACNLFLNVRFYLFLNLFQLLTCLFLLHKVSKINHFSSNLKELSKYFKKLLIQSEI